MTDEQALAPTDPAARLKVLVIGAGRRVQGNFLPVLQALRDDFDVMGIHSRTYSRLKPVADAWNVPAVASLADIDLSAVDVVALSVPTGQNAAVLRTLAPHAAHLKLVIDTPIAWNRQELKATAPLLDRFSQVVVTEDYMNFPTFELLRSAVQQGWVGRPQALVLNNTGYLYHGLALIRSFVGFEPVVRTWRRNVGAMTHLVGYRFRNGFEAAVIGPYRGHSTGGLSLEGSAGVITEFESDFRFAQPGQRPFYRLSLEREDGRLTGCRIEGNGRLMRLEPAELKAMQAMPFEDKSDLNLLRGCGLANVFRSLREPDNLNASYGVRNAFYDGFVSRLADRGRFPFDPFTWFNRNAVATACSVAGIRLRAV